MYKVAHHKAIHEKIPKKYSANQKSTFAKYAALS